MYWAFIVSDSVNYRHFFLNSEYRELLIQLGFYYQPRKKMSKSKSILLLHTNTANMNCPIHRNRRKKSKSIGHLPNGLPHRDCPLHCIVLQKKKSIGQLPNSLACLDSNSTHEYTMFLHDFYTQNYQYPTRPLWRTIAKKCNYSFKYYKYVAGMYSQYFVGNKHCNG